MSKVVGGHVLDWHILIITARVVGGSAHPEKIEEMDRELTRVIEDFNYAVDIEALRIAKMNREHLFPLPGDNRSQWLV